MKFAVAAPRKTQDRALSVSIVFTILFPDGVLGLSENLPHHGTFLLGRVRMFLADQSSL